MSDSVVHGIHHITAFCGDPAENVNFYTKVLGLRLVKKSVNQDAPDVYHFFFADAHGSPGTDITFFPFRNIARMRDGYGLASEVTFAIPVGSFDYWQKRLDELKVNNLGEEVRFGVRTLVFDDPHGLHLALTEVAEPQEVVLWDASPVPKEHQLRGFHTVRLKLHTPEPTQKLLVDVMGFRKVETDGIWMRYESGDGGSGTYTDIAAFPNEPQGRWGLGGIHHVAWRTRDADQEMKLRKKVADFGLHTSPLIDRFWFESVYFQEPNGIVFELATDGPGFERDENLDALGEKLILPPWLESRRTEIEAALPKVSV